MMEVGTVWVVALDRFDECGTVFGGAIGSSDVAAVIVEAV
jgi:hypothetical protein